MVYRNISFILQGFIQLKSESCIFKKTNDNNTLVCIIGLYVNDMVITGNINEINYIINKIKSKFKISKSGPIDYILGNKVEKFNNNYTISQISFINNILERFKINNSRKVSTPCVGDNIKGENTKQFNKTTY